MQSQTQLLQHLQRRPAAWAWAQAWQSGSAAAPAAPPRYRFHERLRRPSDRGYGGRSAAPRASGSPAAPAAAGPAPGARQEQPAGKELLLLVDGHNLAYRFYYALATSRAGGLATSTGIPTSVSHGFLRGLRAALAAEQPAALAVAFDHPGGSFR
jgi:hypothetical protein